MSKRSELFPPLFLCRLSLNTNLKALCDSCALAETILRELRMRHDLIRFWFNMNIAAMPWLAFPLSHRHFLCTGQESYP